MFPQCDLKKRIHIPVAACAVMSYISVKCFNWQKGFKLLYGYCHDLELSQYTHMHPYYHGIGQTQEQNDNKTQKRGRVDQIYANEE